MPRCLLGMAAVLQRAQLHFLRMFFVPKSSSQAHSSQVGRQSLSVFFGRHFFLFTNFPLLTRPPLWRSHQMAIGLGALFGPWGNRIFVFTALPPCPCQCPATLPYSWFFTLLMETENGWQFQLQASRAIWK